MENNSDKPIVVICSWCQKINDPKYKKYADDIDLKVKNEIALIDDEIKLNKNKYTFTHSVCIPHMIQMYKSDDCFDENDIKSMVDLAKKNKNTPPCLLTNEAVRHAYLKGFFTSESQKKDDEDTNLENRKLTERFKKLAGITA